MIRISLGQSVLGGSVDAHRHPDGEIVPHHCVQGAIELPDTPEGWAEAREIAVEAIAQRGGTAYPYRLGEWAPPSGQQRLTQYGLNY